MDLLKTMVNMEKAVKKTISQILFCFVVQPGIFSVARRFKSEAATEESRRE